VAATFADVEDLAAHCRFRDCQHGVEPGCAVTAAVDAGELDPARFASYGKLQRELAADARRRDPVLRQAELARWRIRAREGRLRARPRTR
jgi:ribosome biogenesis GTPase